MSTLAACIDRLDEFKGSIIFTIGIFIFVSYVTTALKPGLRSIPGPILARFTYLYRPFRIAKGDAPNFYMSLHEKYGPIVRTSPNTVDISDPAALPAIYGISSKFVKVGTLISRLETFLILNSQHFIMLSVRFLKERPCLACSL